MAVTATPNREPTPTVSPTLLPLHPAAAYLTIGARTLKSLVASGAIQVVHVSPRRIAFRIADLDAYIESQRR